MWKKKTCFLFSVSNNKHKLTLREWCLSEEVMANRFRKKVPTFYWKQRPNGKERDVKGAEESRKKWVPAITENENFAQLDLYTLNIWWMVCARESRQCYTEDGDKYNMLHTHIVLTSQKLELNKRRTCRNQNKTHCVVHKNVFANNFTHIFHCVYYFCLAILGYLFAPPMVWSSQWLWCVPKCSTSFCIHIDFTISILLGKKRRKLERKIHNADVITIKWNEMWTNKCSIEIELSRIESSRVFIIMTHSTNQPETYNWIESKKMESSRLLSLLSAHMDLVSSLSHSHCV